MRTTYAVTWEDAGGVRSGRLELGRRSLALDGGNGEGPVALELPYAGLAGFHLARAPDERLDGRPALVLELRDGGTVKISSVAQPGILAELAERLSENIGAWSPERAVLVVPLRPGAREAVASLLDQGPPFDPEQVALDRHEVFLTDREAVFVFEGASDAFLQLIAADESVWDASAAWRPHIEGRIRYAEPAYLWASPSS